MKKLNEMNIYEKIGQLFCIGFQGYDFSDNLKYMIEKYKVGNVILFTRNIKDIRQLFILNQEIHNYVMKETGTMPLISIDQEGGMVTRIMSGATFCPGNMTITAAGDKNYPYEIGKLMGEELRCLGINMNLAPSLDVNNNPNNPVINVRSYSDNPYVVARQGICYIKGLQEQGVIATAKHFPGHGDASSDSHKTLPVIPHNRKRLDEVELVPFKEALSTVDAIMSAHVFFPEIEQDNIPGTLSKKVITDLLRKELGYKGLIVSDCMEMKAIDNTFTTPVGCVMGLCAGLDQVMVSATFEKQIAAFEEVYKAYENGIITEKMIDEKVSRTLALKEKSYKLMSKYFYGKDFFEVRDIIDQQSHKALASKIVDESLTLVKGKNLDYKYLNNEETLVITTEPFATTIAEDELSSRSIGSAIYENKLPVKVRKIKVSIEDEEIDEIVELSKKYKQVLVCTYNANAYTNQAKLINRLDSIIENLYVLSTRSPYDINKFKQIKNYLCLYEYTPNSVNTIVKWLKHELIPMGKLPVNLNQKIKCGASVYCGLKEYSLENNLKYLELLKKKNIDIIFMSAHMPERNEKFNEELNIIIDRCNELGIKVSLDISKPLLENFTLPNVYALRLDYGFSKQEILNLYNEGKYVIELNASTVNKELLDYLKFNGVDFNKVRISHNFYPKKYTGLDVDNLINKNKLYHEYGLNVMMFIPSSNMHRPPMFEGLPTLELHRNMNLYAILSTIKYLGADEVFFGDAYCSEEELDIINSFNYDVITLPILINKNNNTIENEVFNNLFTSRIDSPKYFTRSSCLLSNKDEIKPHDNKIQRSKGMITIDNVNFLRYRGEICVMRETLEADERVNIIGKVLANDFVIDLLKPGCVYKFVIVGEY